MPGGTSERLGLSTESISVSRGRLLFRVMRPDEDGLPRLGHSASTLGVRVQGRDSRPDVRSLMASQNRSAIRVFDRSDETALANTLSRCHPKSEVANDD